MKNDTHTPTTALFGSLGPVFGLPFLAQLIGETASDETGLPGIDMTRYALVCLGLVGAILALAWGFRRVLAGNLRGRANKRAMRVVDILPLGGKRQLAVVSCYDRTFVLGLGEREVNLVTELDPDEDVSGTLEQGAQATSPSERAERPAPVSAKTGLFANLLSSARTGLASSSELDPSATRSDHHGSGEARIQSVADTNAASAGGAQPREDHATAPARSSGEGQTSPATFNGEGEHPAATSTAESVGEGRGWIG